MDNRKTSSKTITSHNGIEISYSDKEMFTYNDMVRSSIQSYDMDSLLKKIKAQTDHILDGGTAAFELREIGITNKELAKAVASFIQSKMGFNVTIHSSSQYGQSDTYLNITKPK